MADTPVHTLRPGTLVGQYRVERELGRGAMGVVYLAIQENLERPVALKILNDSLARDREFVGRFFNEARAAASLSHGNIIQVYDAGVEPPSTYFFAMEFVEGETLFERVRHTGCMGVPDALRSMIAVAEALDYGWKRQGLVHGDLKPENIMVNVRGETKLADFGLAKVSGHEFEGDGIMLTPLYAAPEKIQGKADAKDCRSDIYSFGATLYHLLSGQPPFPGTDTQKVLQRHLRETALPLQQRNPKVAKELSDFVAQMLAKTPDKRPQTWEEVARHLRWFHKVRKVRKFAPLAAGRAIAGAAHTAFVRRPHSRRSPAPWLLLLLLAAAGLAAWWYLRPPRPPAKPPAPPAATVQWQATADWNRLKLKLAPEENALARFSQLEQYRRTHPTWQPAEFTDLYQRTHQALAGAPPRETPAEPPKPAPAEPPKPAPAEPPKPAPAEPPKPAPAESPALALERADAYTALIAEIALQFKQLPKSPEPCMQKAREWLNAHAAAGDERTHVRFLAETVFPAFDEYLPKLVARKDRLTGALVTVARKGEPKPVRDITLTELVLLNKTDFGEVLERRAWTDVERVPVLTALGRAAFGAPEVSPQDRRPYLAFLLLTRQPDLLTEQLGQLADDDPDKRLWLILRDHLARADAEGKALQTWRDLARGPAQLGYRPAYRLLQELRTTNSAVAFRHQKQLDELWAACAARVPEEVAPATVRQAQEQLDTDPAAALNLLVAATARYGRLDFPERKEIERLQEHALAALAADAALPEERLSPWALVPAGAALAPDALPCRAELVLRQLERRDDFTRAFRPALPLLRGLCRLDMGDWDAARRVLLERAGATGPELPLALQGCLLFGRAAIVSRFTEGTYASDTLVARLGELERRRGERERVDRTFAALLASYQFLTGDWATSMPPWALRDRHGPQAVDDDNPLARAASGLALAAAQLEAGRRDEVIAGLGDGGEARSGDLRFLQNAAEFLAGRSTWVAVPTRMPPALQAAYARFLLSASLARTPPLEPKPERELWSQFPIGIPDNGILTASTWFDLLLLRTAGAVRNRAWPEAMAEIQAALEVRSPAAVPYYPRLRFLQGGVELLGATAEVAQESLDLVTLATVASPAEQALAGVLTRKGEPAAVSLDTLFWGGWLRWCNHTRLGNADGARLAVADMQKGARTLAQKRFVQALAPDAVAPAPPDDGRR